MLSWNTWLQFRTQILEKIVILSSFSKKEINSKEKGDGILTGPRKPENKKILMKDFVKMFLRISLHQKSKIGKFLEILEIRKIRLNRKKRKNHYNFLRMFIFIDVSSMFRK